MFCKADGAPRREARRSLRNWRAASGSFSIIALASSLSEKAIQEKAPITIASTSAAPTLRGTRQACSPSTSGCSA